VQGGTMHMHATTAGSGPCGADGIAFQGTGSAAVSGATIIVDDANASCVASGLTTFSGVRLNGSAVSSTIANTTVQLGANPTNSSYGAFLYSPGVHELVRNIFSLGPAHSAVGVGACTTATLDGNLITLASTQVSSTGVETETTGGCPSSFPLTLVNNVIQAGSSSGVSIGIALGPITSPSPLVVNKTVSAGLSGTTGHSRALDMRSVSAIVANNLLFAATGATNSVCASESDAAANPASFAVNALFDCSTALYANAIGTSGPTGATGAGCPSGEQCCKTVACLNANASIYGNIAPSGYAAIGFDASLRLTAATPASIALGGLNAAQAVCGPSGGATLSCGNVTVDAGDKQRTCPTPGVDCYSMGAYEY
jgi:hypothetical protein